MLKIILNIIWVLFAGLELFVLYLLAGLVMCVTVVGIPFGIQSFKMASFALWPFGRVAIPIDSRDPAAPAVTTVLNIIWILLFGWWLALAHLVFGLILCVTIIGIPLGVQSFKMMGLALWPFGRQIVDASTVRTDGANVFYVD